nr:12113_t:CDS:2 [Entrophospora candida]
MDITEFINSNEANSKPLNKNESKATWPELQLCSCSSSSDLFSLNNTITYKNNKSGQELLKSISESIELVIWNELENCKAFGVMVDESTDISTNLHFIIYVKYCYEGIIKVCYLKLLEVEESNAITFYNAIINLFDKNVFQKWFIRFSDFQPIIEATLQKIQHEHLEDNPRLGYNLKWLKDKESLMLYGELELEELVSVYGKKYLPDYPLGVIDSVAVQEEWFGFKIVIELNNK